MIIGALIGCIISGLLLVGFNSRAAPGISDAAAIGRDIIRILGYLLIVIPTSALIGSFV